MAVLLLDVNADEWAAAIDSMEQAQKCADKLQSLQTALAKRTAELQAAAAAPAAPAVEETPLPKTPRRDANAPAPAPSATAETAPITAPSPRTAGVEPAAPAAPALPIAEATPAATAAAPKSPSSGSKVQKEGSTRKSAEVARRVTDPVQPAPDQTPPAVATPAAADASSTPAATPTPAPAPPSPTAPAAEEKKDKPYAEGGWTVAKPAEATQHGPKKGARFICIESYTGAGAEELSFTKGETMLFWEADESGWAYGEAHGQRGWFPFSYVATPEVAAQLAAAEPAAPAAPTSSSSGSASSPIAAAVAANSSSSSLVSPPPAATGPTPGGPAATPHASASAQATLPAAQQTPQSVETSSIVANKNVISNKLGNFLGGKRSDKKSLEEKHILVDLTASQAGAAKKEKRDMLTNFFKMGQPASDEKDKKKKSGKGDLNEDLPPAFGQPLEKLLQKPDAKKSSRSGKGMTLSYIPAVVSDCIRFLDKPERLALEGLFRISPARDDFDRLRALWHSMAEPLELESHTQDPHAVAAVLKSFFNALPEPVMTYTISEQIFSMKHLEKAEVSELKAIIGKLPILNKMTVECLFVFLRRVIEFSDKNRMTASNVAIVWGPNLVRPRVETPELLMSRQDTLFVERLLAHSKEIFSK